MSDDMLLRIYENTHRCTHEAVMPQLRALQEEITQNEATIKSLKQEKEKLNQDVLALISENDNLNEVHNDKIEEFKQEKKDLSDQITALQNEKRQLEEVKDRRITELQEEKTKLEEDKDRITTELQEEKTKLTQDNNQRITELQEEKRQLEENKDRRITELQEEKRQLKENKDRRITELQREMTKLAEEKDKKIKELQDELEVTPNFNLDNLSNSLHDAEIDELKRLHATEIDRIKELHAQDFTQLRLGIQELKETHAAEIQTLKETQAAAIKTLKETHAAEIESLEQLNLECQNAFNESQVQNSKLQQQILQLQTASKLTESRVQEAESQLLRVYQELAVTQRQLQERMLILNTIKQFMGDNTKRQLIQQACSFVQEQIESNTPMHPDLRVKLEILVAFMSTLSTTYEQMLQSDINPSLEVSALVCMLSRTRSPLFRQFLNEATHPPCDTTTQNRFPPAHRRRNRVQRRTFLGSASDQDSLDSTARQIASPPRPLAPETRSAQAVARPADPDKGHVGLA